MDSEPDEPPRRRTRALPGRGAGEVAYLDFGPPERPVDAVFLHANGFNAWTYRRILGPLAGRYRLLALDQRGHGATTLATVAEGRRDWLDLRDDLLAFLDALGLDEVVLSGHSMGGTVSLLAAAAEPSRCARLALFDPVVLPPGPVPPQNDIALVQGARRRRAVFASRAEALGAYRGRGAFATWPEAILADYVEAGFRDLDGGGVRLACAPDWEASNFVAQAHDTWGALAASVCPIEALRAETASTFNLGEAEILARGRIRITTVPGTTHFLPMERPQLIQDALAAAIEAPPAPASGRAEAVAPAGALD